MPTPRRAVIAFTLVLALCLAARAYGQPGGQAGESGPPVPTAEGAGTPTGAPTELTVPQLTQLLDSITGSATMEAAVRDALAERVRGAIRQVQRSAELAVQAAEYRRLAAEAPQVLERIRAELASPMASGPVDVPRDWTLQQIEGELSRVNAELLAARQTVAELQGEATLRSERRTVIPEQLARLRQQLAELQPIGPTNGAGNGGESIEAADVRNAEARAARQLIEQEIAVLEAEAQSYDARRDLLPARRDRAQRRISEGELAVSSWQAIASARRQAEAERALREAQQQRRAAAMQHPVLSSFAEETARRAKERTGDAGFGPSIDRATREAAASSTRLATIAEELRLMERRIAASGLNRATGLLLLRQFQNLDDEARLSKRLRASQDALEAAEYALVELQEERLGAGDSVAVARELVDQIPDDELVGSRDEAITLARELAEARRVLLDQMIADASSAFEAQAALNAALTTQLAEVERFRDYIEERILWVRSIAGGSFPSAGDFAKASARWLDGETWVRIRDQQFAQLRTRWLAVSSMVLLVVAFFVFGSIARRRLRAIGDLVSRYRTDSWLLTLRALPLTILAGAPVPVALWVAGWLLVQPADAESLAIALSHGLQSAAVFLLPLALVARATRHRGLVEGHFRWPRPACAALRRALFWLMVVGTPGLAIAHAIEYTESDSDNASLGRLGLTVTLASLAVFALRVLRPSGPVLGRLVQDNPTGWANRLRLVWYPLAVLLPVGLIVLSWLGYHYTAMRLESKLEDTLTLIIVLLFTHGLLHRWLFLARRSVAIEDARRRREQLAAEQAAADALAESTAQASAESGGGAAGDAPGTQPIPVPQVIDEEKIDLPAISAQTRQIFRAAITLSIVLGLFAIWSEALPALRMLDRVQLYPTMEVVDISAVSAGSTAAEVPAVSDGGASQPVMPGVPSLSTGGSEGGSADQPLTITLADLGLALVLLIGTVVAFRNVPGLLEIIVLQRLPLDAGARYALSTVLRYAIAILGVLLAFGAIGISWNNVQWLAAALTFGLAFGLQEIFANFVSGLIILGERPVRLNDTVTVNGVTGSVTRIRMRATTIVDWDRKELIIPNKTFITGEVINWSLSDPILRLIIPVGVSYGSDTRLVEKTLYRVAKEHPTVLNSPATVVMFKGFGASSLDFELRVFIPSIEHLVPIKSELHHAVFIACREAKIEIAFPQLDLHLKDSDLVGKLIESGQVTQSVGGSSPERS